MIDRRAAISCSSKLRKQIADKLRAQLKNAETVTAARKDKIGAFAQEGEFLEMLAKQHQDAEVEDQDGIEDDPSDA